MFNLKRYRPQKLPGHTQWTIRDDETGNLVLDPDKPDNFLKVPTQGKAIAVALKLERTKALPA